MKKVCAAVIVLLCLGAGAQANVFNLGSGLTNLEAVLVEDPGNTADAGGYGDVSDSYYISKYEVTAGQYCDFLNSKARTDTRGLYNTSMWDNAYGCKIQRGGSADDYTYSVAAEWANRPVNYVSYWDACIANWLHNGQGEGSTETGAYALNGYNGNDGREIERSDEAKWFLTSEDEWYKAAYYKSGGTEAGYWKYTTQSNLTPSNILGNPTDPGNNATYNNGYTIGSPYYRTEAGAHENSESAYDTFDQGGNVWEWNEAIVYQYSDYLHRGLRGGSFYYAASCMEAGYRYDYQPTYEHWNIGFRVGAVPEPSSIVVLVGAMGSLFALRPRRR